MMPRMGWKKTIRRTLLMVLTGMLLLTTVGPGDIGRGDELDEIRVYTRMVEFDYFSWTWDAVMVKLAQIALPAADYLDRAGQKRAVFDYLALVGEIGRLEAEINDIYADPDQEDIEGRLAPLRKELEARNADRDLEGPLAEAVIQSQIAAVLDDLGFSAGGIPFPPVLYRTTPLPWALIVSPREVIRQDALISLETELSLDEHVTLEKKIGEGLDVSTLVVPVGGIGSYPTMVAQTTNLPWLLEVVAHEWIHNYLNLRPLGLTYGRAPELRTMNETAASIAGTEISRLVLERFYAELLPPPASLPDESSPQSMESTEPPVFDFRVEMHETRVNVDELLAQGSVDEAEKYMETRRQVFWENGYHIRKINQAYFAFHGAYADVPGGAAGEDPVGAAVRALWNRSDSLLVFIRRMAWLTSFGDLEALLKDLS